MTLIFDYDIGNIMSIASMLKKIGETEIIISSSKEDIENVKIKLVDSINEIIQDQSFSPTNNYRVCSYCEHAKTGACPTGVFRNKKAARA